MIWYGQIGDGEKKKKRKVAEMTIEGGFELGRWFQVGGPIPTVTRSPAHAYNGGTRYVSRRRAPHHTDAGRWLGHT
jgi:hypothetical protein